MNLQVVESAPNLGTLYKTILYLGEGCGEGLTEDGRVVPIEPEEVCGLRV